ncbi:MAG: hypothetical protein E6J12_10180 [Chloroflexi bacterium]|nr:MAG: hypothetical protein E6J12_10180 [Chloroflexota bacterium]
MSFFGTSRAAGGWGIVFVVLLLVSAAMVSVPTAADTGDQIVAFYRAHGQVIVIQQVAGILALGAFIAFGLSLPPNRWLRPALWTFVVTEIATNLFPLIIILTNPAAGTAHTLTFIEDLADAVFFLASALFVSMATLGQPVWLRIAAYAVAVLVAVRAVASPFGVTALDQVAPIAFVALVLVFSIKLLVRPSSQA